MGAPGWPRLLAGATLAGLALALLGPFGNYLNGGLPTRLPYWIGATWAGCLLYGGAIATLGRWAPRPGRRRWALLVLIVLVASLAETALTRAASFALWPHLHLHDPGWWSWFAQTVLIGTAAVTGVEWRASRPAPALTVALPASCGSTPPLPAGVLALQMEDHYVRAHTPQGSTLLLMPMTQAIAQLADTEGLRTHRSWWVSRHAVTHVEGTPRAMRLRLSNGLTAPVARSAVATLRAAGWLAPSDHPSMTI